MKTLGMEDTSPSPSVPGAAPEATPEAPAAAEPDVCDAQALENYRTWKKNAPFLYDVVIVCFHHPLVSPHMQAQAHTPLFCGTQTQDLPCTCLTVDWLPDVVQRAGKPYREQRLLLGTQAPAGDENYLMVAKARLPARTGVYGSVGARADTDAGDVAQEGGYQMTSEGVDIKQRIVHRGAVLRARHMPQLPPVVATLAGLDGGAGAVYVFDTQRHYNEPEPGAGFVPDLELRGGLAAEGYGLAWSGAAEGVLAACGNDGRLAVWDTAAAPGRRSAVDAPRECCARAHAGAAEDVRFHPHSAHVLATAGDDGFWRVWDLRAPLAPERCAAAVSHGGTEVNSVAFAPAWEHTVAAGGNDGRLLVWDVRCLAQPLLAVAHAHYRVLQLEWSPRFGHVLASIGDEEAVVKISDVSRGTPQEPGESAAAAEWPPQLLFVHAGHRAPVTDFSWNANDPWTVASVGEDLLLEVWQPTEGVHTPLVVPS